VGSVTATLFQMILLMRKRNIRTLPTRWIKLSPSCLASKLAFVCKTTPILSLCFTIMYGTLSIKFYFHFISATRNVFENLLHGDCSIKFYSFIKFLKACFLSEQYVFIFILYGMPLSSIKLCCSKWCEIMKQRGGLTITSKKSLDKIRCSSIVSCHH